MAKKRKTRKTVMTAPFTAQPVSKHVYVGGKAVAGVNKGSVAVKVYKGSTQLS